MTVWETSRWTSAPFDVLGIGNAIVDVIARSDDAFLGQHGLVKGSMMLIDEARAEQLYEGMGPGIEVSGGSCGNTMAGIASFGGKGAYIGKVRDDQLRQGVRPRPQGDGRVLRDAGRDGGPGDGALPDPGDARRPADHEHPISAPARVSGRPTSTPSSSPRPRSPMSRATSGTRRPPSEAVLKAFDAARAAGRKVSITLSDSFCVHRYREEFRDLIRNKVDILFGNESEIKALYEVETFEEALEATRKEAKIAALTRSEKRDRS